MCVFLILELLSKCLCSLNFSSYCPDYLCGCGSSHSPTAISSSSDFPTSLTIFSGNSIYTHISQPKLPHVSLVNYSFVVVAVVVISFFSSVLFWVVFIVMSPKFTVVVVVL